MRCRSVAKDLKIDMQLQQDDYEELLKLVLNVANVMQHNHGRKVKRRSDFQKLQLLAIKLSHQVED
jgi:hypothetical protein